MNLKQDVRSVQDLQRDAPALVRDVAERGRTVAIVQDGETQAVLMDIESYDRWRSALALLKIIAQGEADVAAGRLVSQDEAFARASLAIDRASTKADG
ncbi:MAG TPA: type II toxin-antitoxin system Phd/YefM family antitoxin [Thermoanaerobaculia bacterium]|nr:type II toxin-antitoxin system Phd/YefM family antitoxin [Thermoanaerobaculia bacterium]